MTSEELRELAASLESLLAPSAMAASDYLRACAAAMEAGPVAWRYKKESGGWFVSDNDPQYEEQWNDIEVVAPLYPLALPAQPSSNPCQLPEPMTADEIEGICWTEMDRRLLSFARAIEAETMRRVKEVNE